MQWTADKNDVIVVLDTMPTTIAVQCELPDGTAVDCQLDTIIIDSNGAERSRTSSVASTGATLTGIDPDLTSATFNASYYDLTSGTIETGTFTANSLPDGKVTVVLDTSVAGSTGKIFIADLPPTGYGGDAIIGIDVAKTCESRFSSFSYKNPGEDAVAITQDQCVAFYDDLSPVSLFIDMSKIEKNAIDPEATFVIEYSDWYVVGSGEDVLFSVAAYKKTIKLNPVREEITVKVG